MYNKIRNVIFVVCVVMMVVDLSYAFKMPKGLGGKKGKKAAATAIAYNLTAPTYDPALAAFGVIGAYDLGIAGAPVCLKVMEVQINLALANKANHKAMSYLTEALANKETKATLLALQEELDKEKDAEKKRVKMTELTELQKTTFDGLDEKKEISKEQAELLTKAGFVTAGSALLLANAVKETAELPKLIKDGIDEVKDAIKDAKSGGFKAMKAIGGLTGNLKGIQGAATIPGLLIDNLKLQKQTYSKIGKMLKNNKYDSPSMEDAQKSDKKWTPDDM